MTYITTNKNENIHKNEAQEIIDKYSFKYCNNKNDNIHKNEVEDIRWSDEY